MSWIAEHPWLICLGCLLAAFVLLNVLAFRHGRAMTHILPAGGWRRKPEQLTRLQKVRALLMLLAPLTTGSVPDGARFLRGAP